MNRVERLQAALAGERVDRPPFSFWHPFGLQHMPGEAVAAAHITFARRFEPDFLKVMNDYPYPIPELLSLDRPGDWASLSVLNGKEAGWGHQLQALEMVVKALKGRTWVVDTVYSPWTILSRLGSRDLVLRTARENPGFLRHALDVVSKSLANYVRHAMGTGIQGIYFGVSEARHGRLTPEEYQEWCAPYDRVVLEAAAAAPFNILHLHGSRVRFDVVAGYPAQALSWSHFHTGPGLARGLEEGRLPVLGGLDEATLHRQTPGALRHYFQQHAEELWLPRLILTPGCSLRPDVSPHVLDAVRAGVESLRRLRPPEGQSRLQDVLRRPDFEGPRSEAPERPRRRTSGPVPPVQGEWHPGAPPGSTREPFRGEGVRPDRPRRFEGQDGPDRPRRFEGQDRPDRPRRFEGQDRPIPGTPASPEEGSGAEPPRRLRIPRNPAERPPRAEPPAPPEPPPEEGFGPGEEQD